MMLEEARPTRSSSRAAVRKIPLTATPSAAAARERADTGGSEAGRGGAGALSGGVEAVGVVVGQVVGDALLLETGEPVGREEGDCVLQALGVRRALKVAVEKPLSRGVAVGQARGKTVRVAPLAEAMALADCECVEEVLWEGESVAVGVALPQLLALAGCVPEAQAVGWVEGEVVG